MENKKFGFNKKFKTLVFADKSWSFIPDECLVHETDRNILILILISNVRRKDFRPAAPSMASVHGA